jgi:hypothetical protein
MTPLLVVLVVALSLDPVTPARFVAESALNAEALAQIAAVQWDSSKGCLPPVESDVDAESAGAARYPELTRFLESSSVIAVGRIETLTPGWDVTTHRPATLAAVRVTESLRGAAGGERLTYVIDGGRIVVDGRALCTEPHDEMPKTGDTVLVAGRREASASPYLITTSDSVFPEKDRAVIVPPWLNLAGEHRVPLESLRSKFRSRIEKP